jgi:hypothetical protein
MQLVTQEDFITFSHNESFKSQKIKANIKPVTISMDVHGKHFPLCKLGQAGMLRVCIQVSSLKLCWESDFLLEVLCGFPQSLQGAAIAQSV